jgi:hypothetical protein
MILHLLQIFFTLGLTFIAWSLPAALGRLPGRALLVLTCTGKRSAHD